MAIIGNNSAVGAGADNNPSGFIVVSKAIAGGDGTLGSGWLYLATLGGTGARSQKCRLVIYNDSGGVPGTLRGVTNEFTFDDTMFGGDWFEFPSWTSFGGAPSVVNGTAYWIGVWWGTQVNGALIHVEYQNGAPNLQYYNGAETYSSTSNPPTTPGTSAGVSRTFSMYFDISASVGSPVNSSSPVISGTPSVGSTLSVNNGTWTNSPSSYAYQWKNSSDGIAYTNIGGATSSSYVVVSGDIGKYIRCDVTATNGSGSTAAASNALQVPSGTGELIVNRDFEVDASSWNSSGGGVISRDTSAPLTGIGSGLITTDGLASNEGAYHNRITSGYSPGGQYIYSFQIKGTASIVITGQIDEFDASGAYISSQTGTIVLNGSTQTFSLTFTPTAGAAQATPRVFLTALTATTFRIDNVSLLPAAGGGGGGGSGRPQNLLLLGVA